jgi:hypothetical protein
VHHLCQRGFDFDVEVESGRLHTRSKKTLVESDGSEMLPITVRAPLRWPATMLERPFWTSYDVVSPYLACDHMVRLTHS